MIPEPAYSAQDEAVQQRAEQVIPPYHPAGSAAHDAAQSRVHHFDYQGTLLTHM